MQSLKHTNSAIQKNRQMLERLSSSNVLTTKPQIKYSSSEVQYYNDETAIKKKKRKKVAKWLTLGFAGLTILSIASTIAIQAARKKLNLNDIKDATEEARKSVGKYTNRMVNLDHLKNDLWTRLSNFISEKTPIKINKWFNEPISKKYCEMSKTQNAARHANAREVILTHAKKLEVEQFTYNYSDESDAIYKAIDETLNKKGNRVGDVLLEGFKKQNPDESLLTRIQRGFKHLWKVSGDSVIADDKISDIAKMRTQGLTEEYLPKGITVELLQQASSKDKTVAQDAFKKMVSIIEELLPDSLDKNPSDFLDEELNLKALKGTVEKLMKSQNGVYNGYIHMEDFSREYHQNTAEAIAKALIELNEIETKGMAEGIAKMRDIATGDAAFDVLTMIGSVGGLGIAVAAEDDKEKRKSTVINLGIPLISTLGCSLFGCFKNIPKETGAIIGLVAGTIASQGAKALDNLISKNKEKKDIQA